MNRLSSGQRITSAGDDAAGLAISSKLDSEVRGLQQAQRNANDGVSFVQTAEGGLNEVSNILVRLRELGVQAASDTVGDEERSFINKEYTAMKAEIDRISQVTKFNGHGLLDGSGGELSFQVGNQSGENNMIRYDSSESNASTSSLGISGAGVSSKSDASDSLDSVDAAIQKVNGYRSSLGAIQSRLHSANNEIDSRVENLSGAKSRISDTDIAEESSKLVRSQVLENVGVAVLAQANASPNVALKLL
jgi:flagellin